MWSSRIFSPEFDPVSNIIGRLFPHCMSSSSNHSRSLHLPAHRCQGHHTSHISSNSEGSLDVPLTHGPNMANTMPSTNYMTNITVTTSTSSSSPQYEDPNQCYHQPYLGGNREPYPSSWGYTGGRGRWLEAETSKW